MPRATEQELRIWAGASNLEPELKVGAVVRAGAQGRYVRTRIGYEKEFEFAALGQGLERKKLLQRTDFCYKSTRPQCNTRESKPVISITGTVLPIGV